MIDTRKIATIIGGDQFVESYIVERLVKKGFVVRLAVAQPANVTPIKIFGSVGQVVPLYCNLDEENTLVRAVEGASVVINLAEAHQGKRLARLNDVNVRKAEEIACLCAAAGVEKLLHFSALNAGLASPSAYLFSKKKGEEAVQKVFPSAIIVRPGIIFGPEDQFLNKLGLMATFLPIMPVYNVNTRLQPVYAGDVADAVVRIIDQENNMGQAYDLAGPDVYTNRELVNWLVHWLHRNNDISGLFPLLISFMAFMMQLMPGSLMTLRLVNLMKYDSILGNNANGLLKLGIVPNPIQSLAPLYLYCYRPANDQVELQKLLEKASN